MALAKAFELVEGTSSRLKIIEIMSDLYRSVIALTPDDLIKTVYLSLNKVAPAFEGVELGVGESLIISAIADATGKTLASVKKAYQDAGDLGTVAQVRPSTTNGYNTSHLNRLQACRKTQKTLFQPAPLTIRNVFAKLLRMAQMSGNSSQQRKRGIIQSLIVGGRDQESVYLVRYIRSFICNRRLD